MNGTHNLNIQSIMNLLKAQLQESQDPVYSYAGPGVKKSKAAQMLYLNHDMGYSMSVYRWKENNEFFYFLSNVWM